LVQKPNEFFEIFQAAMAVAKETFLTSLYYSMLIHGLGLKGFMYLVKEKSHNSNKGQNEGT
jgi:hypothetical protein